MNESRSSVGSTRSATFDWSSRSSRSLRWREVRNCPSPVSGESLTVKSMLKVGSSTSMRGKAIGRSLSAIVSPMSTTPRPDHGDDVARPGLVDLLPAELVEDEQVVDRTRPRVRRRP